MSQTFKKPYNVKMPKKRHEEEEFGPGKKGLVICPECNSTYFKKCWHHDLIGIDVSDKKDTPIKFVKCPACAMVANKQYEGRLAIKNVPSPLVKELEGLIRGFCQRAFDRDPMDRLIEIKKGNGDWEVMVTENQLANKLGQKIKHTFNRVKTKTVFAGDPSDVVEILVQFS